jgi:putative ABC transport system permease protein
MLKHNLILIYRNFLRSKGFFMINLVGLSTGLACTLLIFLWVRDEMGRDQFHEKDARLFQVLEHQQYAGEIMTTTSTPGVLADALKDEIPEVEYAATTTWISPFTLSNKDHNVKADGYYVGPDFFNIFSYSLVQGKADQVLADKSGIVISRELAVKLFSTEEDVIGKTVEVQHEKSFQVTGVFDKVPGSSQQFDFVLSFDEFKIENTWAVQWGNNGPPTYITLHEGSDPEAVSLKIKDFVKGKNDDSNVSLFLVPFSSRYLHGPYKNGKQEGGRIVYVRLFSIVAIFILLIACINFMNLSTARASRKAKEVGIKKSVGAQRHSLIFQYISESMVTAILSLIVALAAVYILLPAFNLLTDKRISFTLTDPVMLGSLVGITLFTGLLAGSYPAIFLSGFKPAAVLKGELKGSWGELWARKGLVVFQFSLSVILIVSVMVIYKQIEFVQNINLGYKKDNLIRLPIEGKVETSLETFLTEVRNVPGVIMASTMGHNLLGRNNNTSGLEWEGKNPDDVVLFENVRVNYDMIETLGVELVEGRSFSREHSTDTSAIILNEAAVRIMGFKDPIGKTIKLWERHNMEIIGIVKDFHFQSLHDVVNPLFFALSEENTWNVMIRLEGGKETETLKALEKLYTSFNPGFTFDYKFQDAEYARMYASEQRVASLSGYFALFAIIISCLGLFGLAAFTAERRLKEIGIRKALGSSSTNIVLLLSGDFTRMVFVSILLGLPISYWFLNSWFLPRFAFHIELSAWYFVIGGMIALIIAWLTVASQAIKAANVNPVKCLRSE